jgi:hypothetical protein
MGVEFFPWILRLKEISQKEGGGEEVINKKKKNIPPLPNWYFY